MTIARFGVPTLHKTRLRIKLAVFRMDDGFSESAIVQGVVGPDHRSGAYHRDRDGVVPVPADDGKEEAEVNAWRGRRGQADGFRPERLRSA